MQRKQSVISVSESSRKFCCAKYSLMACNAFGIMLGIFVVLFGISYPVRPFPGGYSGQTTAGISAVFIFFTGIGYCGAHHHKSYFLILYSIIIVVFLGGNIMASIFLPSLTLFDPSSGPFYIMACLMLGVMALALFLAWQVRTQRLEDQRINQASTTTFSPMVGLQSAPSVPVQPTDHQLRQQTAVQPPPPSFTATQMPNAAIQLQQCRGTPLHTAGCHPQYGQLTSGHVGVPVYVKSNFPTKLIPANSAYIAMPSPSQRYTPMAY